MELKTGPEAQTPFRPRKALFVDEPGAAPGDLSTFEDFDLAYRTLCAVLFNFVPTSGHPGGSISSGRIAEGLLFDSMDYDFSNPSAPGADLVCYAGGHKAMGLYALWALRDEVVRIARPDLLPEDRLRLRLEDLLGFRRNPVDPSPLFRKFKAKALDGHPSPLVPFVPCSTGASGVGVGSSLGLALGARDLYGPGAPRVHFIEGEGGMTPGRVAEALASAATMGIDNAVMHVDWNQASIDSERVCAEGPEPGDYVQWDPCELLSLHGWNVVFVREGLDFKAVLAGQRKALSLGNGQPTAVVYRTRKGWGYGIEGRSSHGAGHPFCSEGYYAALRPFEAAYGLQLPRFSGEKTGEAVEKAFFDTLMAVRKALETRPEIARQLGGRVAEAAVRVKKRALKPRPDAPRLEAVYASALDYDKPPSALAFQPGQSISPRGALGDTLGHWNKASSGAVLACAADLLGSTSVTNANAGFPKGFHHCERNPGSRMMSVGGICEDAMGAMMAGLSTYGGHIGVTSSYSGFIAALEHVAARLHGIGQQARRGVDGKPFKTWVMINAHAGPKTGEDGPTHADPQALQLLQDNFPKGVCITLVPWDPSEVWPLMCAGLSARPAVLAPFVSRPNDEIPDREALSIAPASAAAKGVYAVRRSQGPATVVLQGGAVMTLFMRDVLPKLDAAKARVNVFYVTSAELFDLLKPEEQEAVFPLELRKHAMGITDFTLPTLWRWVRSEEGLRSSLHAFRNGHFLGSGVWERVMAEGGLDGEAQLAAVQDWVRRWRA
jgi:transketolase